MSDNHLEMAIADAVVELHQERELLLSMEQLLAKALACHLRGERCSDEWSDKAMSILRLIQNEREQSNVQHS